MKEGHGLCRAQLGHDWRDVNILNPHNEDEVLETYPVPAPLKRDRMKPLPDKAKEGRINPKGIPCLYLSDNKETAMSEVRPWLEAKISVSYFKTVKDMKLVYLSLNYDSKLTPLDFMYSGKSPRGIRKKTTEYVWKTVDRAFSKPVTLQDDTADYAPTQIISERFRSEGYDGVYYKSALNEKGYNVALFDIGSAQI